MADSILQPNIKECYITGLTDKEIWRPIAGYESFYEVSSKGRVRSCQRTITQIGKYGFPISRVFKGKVMQATDNGKGYLIVTLRKPGNKRKNCYVHRLVATAFIEHDSSKDCVNHKDYDIKNNAVENLEWVTQRENVLYSVHRMRKPRTVLPKSNTGEKYIYKRGSRYRLCYPKAKEQTFGSLEDAVSAREVILCG